MPSLPPLQEIQDSSSQPESPLAHALTILFEHSPILISRLVPELVVAFGTGSKISSYSDLLDLAFHRLKTWDTASQCEFISAHPRIGESNNLSNLSSKEQGAQGPAPTPPEVLARLKHLNVCYETVYPGLRYITFVNGRSRAEIAEEMEEVLDLEHSLLPKDPALVDLKPADVGGEQWRTELNRATNDIGRIAQNRLKALGVQ